MAKKLLGLAGIIMIILLAFGAVCAAADTGVTVGKQMPSITLNALNGQSITITPSGKITIINFWATWCPPCRQEMPELNQFYSEYRDKVMFYAINLQEDGGQVNDFMYNNGYSIPTLLDSDGSTSNLFKIQFIPTTIVADQNGVIQFRKSGAITRSELEYTVNNLL